MTSHATAMYATKRRRRNSKNVRTVCSKDSHSKSNPSKRHRERLNQELDTLASLLPFEASVLSKLDKLSILRLSVSYLRTKSYFQAALASNRLFGSGGGGLQVASTRQPQQYHNHGGQFGGQQLEAAAASQSQQQHYPAELRSEGDLIVQALNGFLLILTCDGEVFYTSHTVETYLGFHQSDICHQSVYELVHSEDREELMQQLKWNSMLAQNSALSTSNGAAAAASTTASAPTANMLEGGAEHKSAAQMSLQEILASADHRHLLERNFTVRFRCLLDNTSGFLRLDIRGRIKVLHGQQNQHNLANSANAAGNKKQSQQQQQQQQMQHVAGSDSQPMLAFFGVCIPFGPPSLLEMPSKDSVFKSKHRLDLSIISMDSRGKQLIGLTDLSGTYNRQLTGEMSPSAVGGDIKPPLTKIETGSGGGGSAGKSPTGQASSATSGKQANQAASISAYDLVHHDDLSYMASAHQELLKTGASGLIAYRMIVQSEGGNKHQWLQTSAKLYYKNSKPDFILCTHRPLMEEEGRDLLGKRTMDFKVTYLDVGLSSINDRIMACDKFSSLQALGSSAGGASRASKSPAGGNNNSSQHLVSSPALSAGESSRSLASLSPQSTLATDDGQAGLVATRKQGAGKRAATKQYSYDLNHHLAANGDQQYLKDYEASSQGGKLAALPKQPANSATFNGSNNSSSAIYDANHYKRGQNGDVFYDMDGADESRKATAAGKKKPAGGKAASGKMANKKRDHHQLIDNTGMLTTNGQQHQTSSASKKCKATSLDQLATSQHLTVSAADLQQQHAAAASSMDQQLHLYNHYTNQHHHLHQETDPTAAYPAIQAAAAYAASLGHSHAASAAGHHHHHQGAYSVGSTVNQLPGYNHHHHTHHQTAAMYGSTSMVSPSSAAYVAQHQHHHSHHLHHHLDHAAAGYHQSAASHYGAFGTGHHQASATATQTVAAAAAAVSNPFLPAERLLHHYSRSARSAAALAAWQTPGAASSATSSAGPTAADYHQHHNHSHHMASGAASSGVSSHQQHQPQQQQDQSAAYASGSSAWGAAAAALVAGSNDKRNESDSYSPSQRTATDIYNQRSDHHQNQQQYQHQHQQHQSLVPQQQSQQQQQLLVSAESGSPTSNKSALGAAQRYSGGLGVHGQHHSGSSDAMKAHGPASLSSDGSAHRSPLSSGESSNGSGSLTTAQAVAVAAGSAMVTDSSAMISPSAYYLPTSDQQQQQQSQHLHRQHHQNHHQQQQEQQQQQQQQQQHNHHPHHQTTYAHHHHHSQQLAAYHHQHPYTAAAAAVHQYGDTSAAHQFNQYHHQQMGSTAAAAAAEAAYFHHSSSAELAGSTPNPGHAAGASSAISAVKLYGANGKLRTAAM